MFFWESPSFDLQVSIWLLVLSFAISLIFYFLRRNFIFSILLFSVLGNLSFLFNIGSRMFVTYNMIWFSYFSLFIWPIINLLLIIYYAYKKNQKK